MLGEREQSEDGEDGTRKGKEEDVEEGGEAGEALKKAAAQVHLPLVAGILCADNLDSFTAQGEQRELTTVHVYQESVHAYQESVHVYQSQYMYIKSHYGTCISRVSDIM